MQEVRIAHAVDVTGTLSAPFKGTHTHKVGLSPGTKGYKNPDGSYLFELPSHTLTVVDPPANFDTNFA